MKKRLVLGVTGIRSEYDIMSSVFRAVDRHPRLDLRLFVTGAHLSPVYGRTVTQVRRDGFRIAAEVASLPADDAPGSRSLSLAKGLEGLVRTIRRLRPDFILVLGDREEALAAAAAGNDMGVAVAHVAGGDRVIGNSDDQTRHAVSKLAHLHFATNEESAERLRRMGEQAFRVRNAGNPGLDRLREVPRLSAAELSRRLGATIREGEPLIALIQHPLSSQVGEARRQMVETLEAVKALGVTTVASYPNSDPGSRAMIAALKDYERRLPFLKAFPSLPRLEFVNLLRRAGCLLGNSSAGLLEAPFLRLPVVNAGDRQKGRLQAGNAVFVPNRRGPIAAAVRRALFDRAYRAKVARLKNPYGDGRSSERIARTLAAVPLDRRLLVKDITY